jgi:opine dehydrogenase
VGKVTTTERPVAILGAGNGGQCAAADLTLAGFRVNLFQLRQFEREFDPVLRSRQITLEGVGRTGTASLHKVTYDVAEALEDVEIVLVIVPSFGHATMADLAAPYLRDGQTVAFLPGNGGSLEWHRILGELGVTADVLLAETCTLPYGARLVEPGRVRNMVEAVALPTGVFPAKRTDEAIPKLRELYPAIAPCKDVLEAAINNANPIVHPAATLLNAGRIEYSRGDFYLYVEGMCPSVARVYESLNEDRLAICDRVGWQLYHWDNLDFRGYQLGETLEEMRDRILNTSMDAAFGRGSIEPGMQMIGPRSMQDRFVTEDVPYGLTLMQQIGQMVGVPTPTTEAIIRLCSVINRADYMVQGRGIEELGLEGLDAQSLVAFLREGSR